MLSPTETTDGEMLVRRDDSAAAVFLEGIATAARSGLPAQRLSNGRALCGLPSTFGHSGHGLLSSLSIGFPAGERNPDQTPGRFENIVLPWSWATSKDLGGSVPCLVTDAVCPSVTG